MGRKKEAEGGTRDRIIEAALPIFMEKGYEQTSVRMIVEGSGTVVGSFYHFFPSKEALFEAVTERYLARYSQRIAAIAEAPGESAPQKLDKLLFELERASSGYFSGLQADKLHWTVQYSLHQRTMQSLLPSIERMVQSALNEEAVKSRIDVDTRTLAAILLNGVEAILHAKPMNEALIDSHTTLLKKNIKDYVALILEF